MARNDSELALRIVEAQKSEIQVVEKVTPPS